MLLGDLFFEPLDLGGGIDQPDERHVRFKLIRDETARLFRLLDRRPARQRVQLPERLHERTHRVQIVGDGVGTAHDDIERGLVDLVAIAKLADAANEVLHHRDARLGTRVDQRRRVVRPRRDAHAFLGHRRQREPAFRCGLPEVFPQRFREEWHHRVNQPQDAIEHADQHPLADRIAPARLAHLDVPVAEFAPSELVNQLRHVGKLVCLERRCHRIGRRRQPRHDPAIFDRHRRRIDCPRRVTFEVH